MKLAVFVVAALSCGVDIFGCDHLAPDFGTAKHRPKRFSDPKSNGMNRKWNATWTDKLKKDLLLNYDKFARPAQAGTKILVKIDMVIRHLEMDEQRSIMTLHSWMRMEWNDEKLKWDANEYGGLKELHLADHEIWQPDIYPYNGVIGDVSDHFGHTNCIAYESGSVLWVPPSLFQIFCNVDTTYWPFDTQKCSLVVGSWTYNREQVDLQLNHTNEEEDKYLLANYEWKVVKVDRERHSTLYSCCPVPYTDVTFTITVERQYPTYVALLITPATVVIIMTLAVFLIPPTSTDKITLGGSAIIITCLFLLYFTQKLPIMAGRTPLIVLFYSRTLYFLSFSIVISAIVINLAKNPKFSPLPWSIKNLLSGKLGKCLLISNFATQGSFKSRPASSYKPDEIGDNLPVLSESEKQQAASGSNEMFQQEWVLLAVAIDRIALLFYCLVFTFLAISYLV